MNTNGHELTTRTGNSLFDRVVIILEQARTNVVHTVNSKSEPQDSPQGLWSFG